MAKSAPSRKGIAIDKRLRSACHEAGHAVAAICMGIRVTGIELHAEHQPLQRNGPQIEILMGGHTGIAFAKNPSQQQLFNECCVLVAGCVAECVLISRDTNRPSAADLVWLMIGAHDDLVLATERIREVTRDSNFVGDALMGTKDNLEKNWGAVRRVADAVVKRGRLTTDEIIAIGWPGVPTDPVG